MGGILHRLVLRVGLPLVHELGGRPLSGEVEPARAVDRTADNRDETWRRCSDRSHAFLVAAELFLYFLAFPQRERRFHSRESLRDAILRRHARFLPVGSSRAEVYRTLRAAHATD